jgi:hypothetical protein
MSEIVLTIDRSTRTCHALITWQGGAARLVVLPGYGGLLRWAAVT